MAKARGDFTDLLIKTRKLTSEQLDEALSIFQRKGGKLQDALVETRYVSELDVCNAIADFHNVPFVEIDEVEIPPGIIELVPESVARENTVIPMAQENGSLMVIVADPGDQEVMEKLQFILNKEIQPVMAPRPQILEAINRHYGQTEQESVDSMLAEFTDTAIDFTETDTGGVGGDSGDESDAPVVKLVNLIIQEAVNMRASDIHVEPFVDRVRVRYRIDGVLVERDSPPRRMLAPMLARIKVMAGIDIAEKRRPQDGRIKMPLSAVATTTCA